MCTYHQSAASQRKLILLIYTNAIICIARQVRHHNCSVGNVLILSSVVCSGAELRIVTKNLKTFPHTQENVLKAFIKYAFLLIFCLCCCLHFNALLLMKRRDKVRGLGMRCE